MTNCLIFSIIVYFRLGYPISYRFGTRFPFIHIFNLIENGILDVKAKIHGRDFILLFEYKITRIKT